jgi:hypothetical protein
MITKQNWFNTLNAALNSECLIDLWPQGVNVSYNETLRINHDSGLLISITRNNDGMYERPVHYSTL